MTSSMLRCFARRALRCLCGIALAQLAACSRQERALEYRDSSSSRAHADPRTSTRAELRADASSAAAAESDAAALAVEPVSAILHEQRPLATQGGLVHRFRIPLVQARFSFVDLGYERPLVEALGDAALLFNGGYWAYHGARRAIQGLVIVNDEEYAPKTAARGGVLEVRGGEARMTASGSYEPRPGTALALQCSPRLVSDGQVVDKLDALRRAARTALCVGSDASNLDLYLTPPETSPTLRELAEFLRAEGCLQALNLDGGPSTAAVAREPAGVFRLGLGLALPYGVAVNLAAGARR